MFSGLRETYLVYRSLTRHNNSICMMMSHDILTTSVMLNCVVSDINFSQILSLSRTQKL